MAVPRFLASRSHLRVAALNLSSTVSANFDIYGACCLQRFPVIQPQLNDIEQRAKDLFRQMEIRNSLLSEHEVRHRNDQALLKKKAKAAAADPSGTATVVESGPFITAVEAEDMWEAEKQRFKFAPRATEADEKNDTSSTKRSLDKKLIFLAEQKIGKDYQLMLPQALWTKGETLRQTAERALTAVLPSANPPPPENVASPFPPLVRFIGNAPVGVYSYRYPKVLREKLKKDGLKVFFFKAHLMDWQIPLKISDKDFRKPQWLSRDELLKALPEAYGRSVAPFILDF